MNARKLAVALGAVALASPASAQAMDPDMAGMEQSAPAHHDHDTAASEHGDHGMAGMDMAAMHMASDGMPAAGSGTSRMPGSAHRHGLHFTAGSWNVMVHGQVFTTYSNQGGPRGGDRTFFTSHLQVEGTRQLSDKVDLTLRGLFSADPLIGQQGYPLLFAVGETAFGKPLVDRQHPHDVFAELTARLDVKVADATRLFLYGGVAGEPALGPSVYLHRDSAKFNPETPITHHWFDSTHLSFGVVTAGLATRHVQVEASGFRGREPDAHRYDIERPSLDSYSARVTWNPVTALQASLSFGRLKSPEELHPDEDETRTIATLAYSAHGVAVTTGYGRKNRLLPHRIVDAYFAEGNWDISPRHALFGRFENVNNDELFPDPASAFHDRPFRISKFAFGYAYSLPLTGKVKVAVGALGSVYAKPAALDTAYGRAPKSFVLFARVGLGH